MTNEIELKGAEKFTLKSGAVLQVAPADFSAAKNLWKKVLKELKTVDFKNADMMSLFCSSLSSDDIEQAAIECFGRCLYKGAKLTLEVFDEDPKAREDYIAILVSVATVNLAPFAKSLYVEYEAALAKATSLQS